MLGLSVWPLLLCLLLGKGLGFANAGPDATFSPKSEPGLVLSRTAQTHLKGNVVFRVGLPSPLAASLGQAQAPSYF